MSGRETLSDYLEGARFGTVRETTECVRITWPSDIAGELVVLRERIEALEKTVEELGHIISELLNNGER